MGMLSPELLALTTRILTSDEPARLRHGAVLLLLHHRLGIPLEPGMQPSPVRPAYYPMQSIRGLWRACQSTGNDTSVASPASEWRVAADRLLQWFAHAEIQRREEDKESVSLVRVMS